MAPTGLSILLRFWVGTAGSISLGLLAFGLVIFDPSRPAVQCITVGLLVSGLLTTVRLGSYPAAVGLVAVFSAVRLGTANSVGWGSATYSAFSSLVLGFGVILIAIVYDQLARKGIRFGKFIVVGPLLTMLFVALVPLAQFQKLVFSDPTETWIFEALLGFLIGSGAGFGVELTELLTHRDVSPDVESQASGEAA